MKYGNDGFMIPEKAWKKLQYAKKENQSVYIYGATLYGKTELVKHFLDGRKYVYLSCTKMVDDSFNEKIQAAIENEKNGIVVLDDLYYLNEEEGRNIVLNLLENKKIWTILIHRCMIPSWLMPSYVKHGWMLIEENDLHLTEKELSDCLSEKNISLSLEERNYICKAAVGNGYCIRHSLLLIQKGIPVGDELTKLVTKAFVDYLEKTVLENWDTDLLDFLMQVSVVDEFDLSLAELITGNHRVTLLIDRAMETGNFISEKDGIYILRPQLLPALRNRAEKVYGLERVREYMYNAGLYYETKNKIVEALDLYEKSGHKSRIKELLIRNARRNPSVGFYFELRSYYLELEKEEVLDSPILMSALSMLYSILMQPEESEYWYEELKKFAKTARGGMKREAMSSLAYLELGLPHRGSKGTIEIVLKLARLIVMKEISLQEFSVTSNLPSVMNGGKDFCIWSKHDRELAATIGKPTALVLGKYGKGLVNEALGESLYEKGGNDYEIISLLSRAQLEAENGGKLELLFAITGLQVRFGMVHGDIITAKERLNSFEKKIKNEETNRMLLNLQAIRCRIALCENDTAFIERWLETAPDENEVFFSMERYRYLTKVRCYIWNGSYEKALSLLERLQLYAEQCKRVYVGLETRMLEAIIRKRLGVEWKELFWDVLVEAHDYEFTRFMSEEGAMIVPLLEEVTKTELTEKKISKEWWGKLIKEARQVAKYYPGYLNAQCVSSSDFSENAIQILKMQAEGMTIRQMADILGLAENTVKYHAGETYRKLGAKGKADAVQKARSLKII